MFLKKLIQKAILFFLILIITISCNKNSNSNNVILKPVDSIESFNYKIQHEPKIFLKYWSGMTDDEFYKVSKILAAEKVLEIKDDGKMFYNMGNNRMRISRFSFKDDYEPSFFSDCNGRLDDSNNKIDGVILTRFNNDIYNVFKNKYNLPDFILKNQYNFYLEKNPLMTTNNNRFSILRKILNEKDYNEMIKQKKWQSLKNVLPYKKRISIKEDIIIKKNNTVLLFKDLVSVCKKPTYFFYEDDDETTGKLFMSKGVMSFGNEKSNFRVVVESDYSEMALIFLDEKVYDKKMLNIKNENKKLEKDRINNLEHRNKRERDFVNEI